MGCVGSLLRDIRPFKNTTCLAGNNDDQMPDRNDVNLKPYAASHHSSNDDDDDGTYQDIGDSIADEDVNSYKSLDLRDRSTYSLPSLGHVSGNAQGCSYAVHDSSNHMSSDLTTGITEGKMRASHAISLTDFSVKSPSTEGLSRRFLECPICLEQYKNPKILPCYHSLCLNCLLQVASGDKITCPVCQQNHDLPPEDVKELPDCTILNDLLEFTESSKEFEENIATIHLCGSCKKKQAENFCVDCGILICNQCCETHRNIPVTKKHTLMSLEEYREEVLVKSRVYRPVVCPLHEGNQITYYCARCEVPVCVKCTESGHTKPEHGLETLSEAREKRQAKLQKTLERAQAKLALSEQRLTKLSVVGKEFAERMTTERGHLEEGFQQMKTKLRIATEYLTTGIATVESEFQSKFDMRNEELARQLRQSESKVTVMSKCISDTTSLLQHSNEIGFLYVVNHTLKRIEQATNNDVESAPKDIDFEYSAETKLQNLNATVVDTLLQN